MIDIINVTQPALRLLLVIVSLASIRSRDLPNPALQIQPVAEYTLELR